MYVCMYVCIYIYMYIYIYYPPKKIKHCKSPCFKSSCARNRVSWTASNWGSPTFQIDELEDVVGNSREGVGAQIQHQHCVRQVVDQGLVWEKITRELRYWQQWPQNPTKSWMMTGGTPISGNLQYWASWMRYVGYISNNSSNNNNNIILPSFANSMKYCFVYNYTFIIPTRSQSRSVDDSEQRGGGRPQHVWLVRSFDSHHCGGWFSWNGWKWRHEWYWLVVRPPLWKIWVRQLGWWDSQY